MVRASGPMLLTTTLNWNVPPGSGRLVGLADFSTRIAGSTLVMVTVASSSVGGGGVAVVVDRDGGDDVGLLGAGVAGEGAGEGAAVGAAVGRQDRPGGARAPAVEVAVDVVGERRDRHRLELRLVTTTLKVKVPPGSGRDAGVAVLLTEMIGRTSVRVTVASSVSVTGGAVVVDADHGDDVGEAVTAVAREGCGEGAAVGAAVGSQDRADRVEAGVVGHVRVGRVVEVAVDVVGERGDRHRLDRVGVGDDEVVGEGAPRLGPGEGVGDLVDIDIGRVVGDGDDGVVVVGDRDAGRVGACHDDRCRSGCRRRCR